MTTQQTPNLPITLAKAIAALEVADSHEAIGNFTEALIAKIKDDPATIPLAFGVADWLESQSDPRMNINAFQLYTAGLQALTRKYCVPDEATYEDAQDILTQEEKDTLYKQVHTQVPKIIERVLATFKTGGEDNKAGHEDNLLLAASDCAASCFTFDPTQVSPKLAKKIVNILLTGEINYNHPFELLQEMATKNPMIFQVTVKQIKEKALLGSTIQDSAKMLCIYLGESSSDNAISMFQTIRELSNGLCPQDEVRVRTVDAMLSSVADILTDFDLQWRPKTLQPAVDLLGDHLIDYDKHQIFPVVASPFANTAVSGLCILAVKYIHEIGEDTVDRLLRRMIMLYAADPKKETAEAIEEFCRHPLLETRQQAVRETIGNVLNNGDQVQKRNVLNLLNCWQSTRHISDALITGIVDDKLFEKIAICAIAELNEKSSFEMANRVLNQQCTTPERAKTLVELGTLALPSHLILIRYAGLNLICTALDLHSDLRNEPTKQLVNDFLSRTKRTALQEQAQKILDLYGPSATPEVKEEPKPPRPNPNVRLNQLTQVLNRSTSQNPALR